MLLARHNCGQYTSSSHEASVLMPKKKHAAGLNNAMQPDRKSLLFSILDADPLADPRCNAKLPAMRHVRSAIRKARSARKMCKSFSRAI